MFTIRNVTPADFQAITEIYRDYVEQTTISFETVAPTLAEMSERIETISATCPYIVAESEGGRLAGFCYAHPWKERAAYAGTLETTVYLDPHFKGNGLGKALMRRLIELCREAGFDSLIACITYGNEASCRLHEGLGFRKVSHFTGVGRKFGKILDVVDYQLTLRQNEN